MMMTSCIVLYPAYPIQVWRLELGSHGEGACSPFEASVAVPMQGSLGVIDVCWSAAHRGSVTAGLRFWRFRVLGVCSVGVFLCRLCMES